MNNEKRLRPGDMTLIGKKLRMEHWTDCYLRVEDVGALTIWGVIVDSTSGAERAWDIFPLSCPWREFVTAEEIITSIKIK